MNAEPQRKVAGRRGGGSCLWLDKGFGQAQSRGHEIRRRLRLSSRRFSTAAALLLVSVILCKGISGGLFSVFYMDQCVGDAQMIVRGLLDEKGNLQALETFTGKPATNRLSVVDGAKSYQCLLASMKDVSVQPTNSNEVIAFLAHQPGDFLWIK